MNDLTSARNLIKVLTSEEAATLHTYLSSFNKMYGSYKPKTLRLFEALLDDHKFTNAEIRAHVSPAATDNTFRMLVMRLRYKIYEVLTSDISLRRSDQHNVYTQSKFEARKRLSQAELLFTRGAQAEADTILRSVVRQCKKYELFQIAVQAVELQLELFGTSLDQRDMLGELQWLEQCRQNCRKAPGLDVEGINELLDETPCATLTYMRLMAEIKQASAKGNVDQAFQGCSRLLQFVKSNPALSASHVVGNSHQTFALLALNTRNYDQAVLHSGIAIRHLRESGRSVSMALECQCVGYLNLHEFRKCDRALSGLSTAFSAMPEQLTRIHLLKAASLFRQQKHRRVHFLLRDKLGVDDAHCNNFGAMLLYVMNQLAWGGVLAPIAEMINHLSRQIVADGPEERWRNIANVLQNLSRNGFDYDKTRQECSSELSQFAQSYSANRWDPLGSEPIRFDVWFAEMQQLSRSAEVDEQVVNTESG